MVHEYQIPSIYIQIVSPKRAKEVQKSLQRQGFFTEAVSQPDMGPNRLELFIIGWAKGTVGALGVAKAGKNAVSAGKRMKIGDVVEFRPIRISSLQLDKHVRQAV